MKKLHKYLHNISWFTYRWDIKISILTFHLYGKHHKLGMQILEIKKNVGWGGSLFEFVWYLPTVTSKGETHIDILFLNDIWSNWCIELKDKKLWGIKLNGWEKINIWLYKKIKNYD